jgi:site-specific DNA recombinase
MLFVKQNPARSVRSRDDGGCTGANLDRPALQRLLAAIAAGQVDCVVVFKVECAR